MTPTRGLPTDLLSWCFPTFPGGRSIRPSPEESESVGLGWSGAWDCLFLVNASDGLYKKSLGNPTESNHRGCRLHRSTPVLCSRAVPPCIPQSAFSLLNLISGEPSILNHFRVSGSNCEEAQNHPHFNFNRRERSILSMLDVKQGLKSSQLPVQISLLFPRDQGGKKNSLPSRTSTALGIDELDTSHILPLPQLHHSNPLGIQAFYHITWKMNFPLLEHPYKGLIRQSCVTS